MVGQTHPTKIARGQAQRILEQANAYKEQVVLNAQGEVERFIKLLPEYKAAPEIMRERLYIQTMEKVMKNTPKVMMDGANSNNLTVLPIDKLLQNNPSNQPLVTEQPRVTVPVYQQPTQSVPTITNGSTNVVEEVVVPARKGRF